MTLFEANDYLGGHTHTVDLSIDGRSFAVDTGFIVYNETNYPNFTRLLRRLGVESQPTRMSFSVRCDRCGLEYNGTSLNSLFAQRRNLLRPGFHRMIREILRFNREAPSLLETSDDSLTVGEYLERERYDQGSSNTTCYRWVRRSGPVRRAGCASSRSGFSWSSFRITPC